MTEAEWLACTNPIRMLELLGNDSSKRKLRLFIADGVKALALIFGKDEEVLAEIHERVADRQASEEDLERFLLRGMPELWEHRAPGGNLPSVWDTARMVVRDRFKLTPLEKSEVVTEDSRAAEYAEMCRVLRCIFGNPYHPLPPLAPSLLTDNDGLVVKLAEAASEHRLRPSGQLDSTLLAVLADALEDAGCLEAELLGHLRGPGPHVRGCWVVDTLTGRS